MKETISITEVAQSIIEGKIVAFPTETSYGLLANALNEDAVLKIFKIKSRPAEKVISMLIKSTKMGQEYVAFNERTQNMFEHVFPAPITIIAEATKEITGITQKNTNALRISAFSLIQELFTQLNTPLTATSANISGQPENYSHQSVYNAFSNQEVKPDILFLGGELPQNKPTTIINLTRESPECVREGEIPCSGIIQKL